MDCHTEQSGAATDQHQSEGCYANLSPQVTASFSSHLTPMLRRAGSDKTTPYESTPSPNQHPFAVDYRNHTQNLITTPSLFEYISPTNRRTPTEFRWEIDQISALQPVRIDDDEDQLCKQEKMERKLIRKHGHLANDYFSSTNLIAPSPLHEPVTRVNHLDKIEEEEKSQSVLNLSRSRNNCTQTDIHIPTNIDVRIEGAVLLTSVQLEDSTPDNSGNSSGLRRKLFGEFSESNSSSPDEELSRSVNDLRDTSDTNSRLDDLANEEFMMHTSQFFHTPDALANSSSRQIRGDLDGSLIIDGTTQPFTDNSPGFLGMSPIAIGVKSAAVKAIIFQPDISPNVSPIKLQGGDPEMMHDKQDVMETEYQLSNQGLDVSSESDLFCQSNLLFATQSETAVFSKTSQNTQPEHSQPSIATDAKYAEGTSAPESGYLTASRLTENNTTITSTEQGRSFQCPNTKQGTLAQDPLDESEETVGDAKKWSPSSASTPQKCKISLFKTC